MKQEKCANLDNIPG